MGLKYKRGTTITYYCSFLTLSEQEPTTITDPKITIRHIDDSGVVVTDVNEASLILATENTYYYKWSIPSNAYIGFYNVECQGIVDLDYSEYNETIEVI